TVRGAPPVGMLYLTFPPPIPMLWLRRLARVGTMSSILSVPHFHDEAAAYTYVEARVWPDGRVCPHCGVIGSSGPLKGRSNRIGLYKCYACRKPFSVKVGTVMEASHIPMHVWLQAMHLMASSK